MKLFEIDEELLKLDEAFKHHARANMGDVSAFDFGDYRELLKEEREKKLLNLGCWYKNLVAESKAFKDEIEIMREKKAKIDRKAEWVQNFILNYLEDRETLHNTKCKLSWRKSQTVETADDFDINSLPDGYKTVKITETIDKTLIKKSIKVGRKFDGIKLVEHERLQIK